MSSDPLPPAPSTSPRFTWTIFWREFRRLLRNSPAFRLLVVGLVLLDIGNLFTPITHGSSSQQPPILANTMSGMFIVAFFLLFTAAFIGVPSIPSPWKPRTAFIFRLIIGGVMLGYAVFILVLSLFIFQYSGSLLMSWLIAVGCYVSLLAILVLGPALWIRHATQEAHTTDRHT